jgi:hypothetical protein
VTAMAEESCQFGFSGVYSTLSDFERRVRGLVLSGKLEVD